MPRTQLHADPTGIFLHDAILDACRRVPERTALVDLSAHGSGGGALRISYAEYGEAVERVACGLTQAGVKPGEVIGIYLPNSWEFCVAFHAAMLAGAIPTLINPSYRERELRYQMESSGAVALISDGPLLKEVNLAGLQVLRLVYSTRVASNGANDFADLLRAGSTALPVPEKAPNETVAALPFSSGTTGLPKGVMLSHTNLLTNAYQVIRPDEAAGFRDGEVMLSFLPLYHIYGLNVLLNPTLLLGGCAVLMPRYDAQAACSAIEQQKVTYMPLVPPVLNSLSQAAEEGRFPAQHSIRAVKSGAAPMPPELARRFTSLTGIRIVQGYGMTEASPVTHSGFIEDALYKPESIGHAMALTDCKIMREDGIEAGVNEIGELVMRGPQFMMGYWKSPEATAEALRDGWYWSGDVARRDSEDFYFIVDRRKEMIKFKGFPIAPAEVEAVLQEHPAVRDCAVAGLPDAAAGEIPCAFVVLREPAVASRKLEGELCGHVAERLSSYKQPRMVQFVDAIPRNPSGKILRRELRKLL